MASEPFRIHVPGFVLADLRERLSRTRWPDEVQGSGWDYRTSGRYLSELVEYWESAVRLATSWPKTCRAFFRPLRP